MKINKDRLEKNILDLAKIGKNSLGGIDRDLSSEADREARDWLLNYWEENLKSTKIRIDAIANLWLRKAGKEDLPPIVIGSHHDAVPNGGAYDGALGVLAAMEIMETLIENNIETKHPIEVVSFTGEEPNPFNVSTLGTKVLSGRLTKKDLKELKSFKDGTSLAECIEKIGGNIDEAADILLKTDDIRAFIELHIEQGKRLFEKNQSSATVIAITGIYRENIIVSGEANHGGTTVMSDRRDALLAASELNIEFEKLLKLENNPEVVGTIGSLNVYPNAVSIIPDKVELTLEIRTIHKDIRQKITSSLDAVVDEIEKKRGVKIERKLNLDQPAMHMDKDVMSAITRGILEQGEDEIKLVSMAGHDAANIQRVTKSGMIFCKSINGKSHCPEEFSEMDDIEKTVNAMLKAVLILDEELE